MEPTVYYSRIGDRHFNPPAKLQGTATRVLTWHVHGLESLAHAARLFDLFLSAHPLMPLYVGVAAMIMQRERCGGAT